MQRGAIFDPTQRYRYLLWRSWDDSAPRIGFVMLNPNQADAVVDDPTIRRCLGFARTWGYGSLEVVNLFAYRTAHPAALRQVTDPVGCDNDRHLTEFQSRMTCIILAWGNGGTWQNRDQLVLRLFSDRQSIYCLGTTQAGHPRHPLYLSRDSQLIQFEI